MLKYRKELDGLRCLAVMAVIIYHSGISLFGVKIFKGGFFGVDVFLVLSGYLITDIIINKLDSRSFSLTDFYWRRIKRIVPALIAMLVVTSIVAYKILLPNDLVKFSESLISAIYFGSNYYFLGEDSYVSNASIFKPLLHTWSLAVEWQFYVFYPFLLIFINKFIKKYRVLLLILISVSSIVYANIIVSSYPDLAFYTLLPRAWELILGGIVSFFVKERRSACYSEKEDAFKRRWNSSKNLEKPKVKTEILKPSEWRDYIQPPKGYYVETDSIVESVSDEGYPYRFYRLIKIEEVTRGATRIRHISRGNTRNGDSIAIHN